MADGGGTWGRLGIAPTRDAAAIRRAYAARLKEIRPDEDPAAFQALRAAFEQARAVADRADGNQAAPSHDEDLFDDGAATATSREILNPFAATPVQTFELRLREGRLVDAARVLRDAVRDGTCSLAEEEAMRDRLATLLADLPGVGDETLERIVAALGWEAVAREYDAPAAVVRAVQRFETARWLAALRTAASAGFHWRASRRRINAAARLILSPAPGPLRKRFPRTRVASGVEFWRASRPAGAPLPREIDPVRWKWCLTAKPVAVRLGRWRFGWLLLASMIIRIIGLLTGHH